MLSEFVTVPIQRFGYSIGVEHQRVSRTQPALSYRAIPLFEQPQHRACGIQPFQSVIAPQNQSAEMPAIRVTQPLSLVIVFGEKKGSVSAIDTILEKAQVDRLQESLGVIQSNSALAAQVRLQI